MSQILLSPNEARVLAALVEKSITTPQYYPMTVNALMMASNQKNSRSPVMNLSEGDTGAALNTLEADKLVTRDDNAGRVPKWRHRFHHQLLLKAPTMAVLATLMLRGPQTPAELRANAAVLNGPPDADGIQAALDDLAERAHPMVMLLPRLPGQAAARYAHLLSGTPDIPVVEASTMQAASQAPARAAAGNGMERLAQLEARVIELEARLATLEAALGG
ncbi:YceH family protein [Nevskia sp.]|uniref:YceH family protein n=1 Tax=Nevskia sp. TaxID=1929292 RepID=UPI0025EF091B|nr:YceH family protein [Nevskia sp.]